MPQLYIPADYHSHLLASDFLADYLKTDGRFESPLTHITIDEAIKYFMRTQALIKLMPHYPPELYVSIERFSQIELNSIYRLPYLYFLKYNIGILGDYHEHLLQSPSYEGERDVETYPKYNTYMLDSLNNVIRYAGECAGLAQKAHFNVALYKAVVQLCPIMKNKAELLIPLEEKRQEISRQSHCQDLNENNCPEYYEAHEEIYDVMNDYLDEHHMPRIEPMLK